MGTFEMDNMRGFDLQSRSGDDRKDDRKMDNVRGIDSQSHSGDCNKNDVNDVSGSSRRIKQECIIAKKVYDSCRQQHCNNITHI